MTRRSTTSSRPRAGIVALRTDPAADPADDQRGSDGDRPFGRDAIATAKAQGKSLGGPAAATPKQLNAEAVLAMSPEEFDAVYSTPEGKAMIDAL
jgi:hypothetical protein